LGRTDISGLDNTPRKIETSTLKLSHYCVHPCVQNMRHILEEHKLDVLELVCDPQNLAPKPALLIVKSGPFADETESHTWKTSHNGIGLLSDVRAKPWQRYVPHICAQRSSGQQPPLHQISQHGLGTKANGTVKEGLRDALQGDRETTDARENIETAN
jgi:hypothetical protein